jgi:hypothetical protein
MAKKQVFPIEQVKELVEDFCLDFPLAEGGNNSAGARCRKAALALRKLMTDFRKYSLVEHRK